MVYNSEYDQYYLKFVNIFWLTLRKLVTWFKSYYIIFVHALKKLKHYLHITIFVL